MPINDHHWASRRAGCYSGKEGRRCYEYGSEHVGHVPPASHPVGARSSFGPNFRLRATPTSPRNRATPTMPLGCFKFREFLKDESFISNCIYFCQCKLD
ncbi:hypothetical protein PoB_002396300 [Plakobranchus ocellatus]|uniref:Uncharacterized protein n=1 Tax=Plakobranchus ocellatus TaxID=259542 RepID=A0AAV3ZRI4_9GAST|nr:hypothetical protein PoB_002396300 [Plakobranchus ocellatus]